MSIPVARKRFTVEDYYRMSRVGIFSGDDRVELVDGEIVEMTPMGSRHAAAVVRADRLLSRVLGDDACVRVQLPLRLGDWSEPEPDVAVVRPRSDFYAERHPGPRDVYFLVEISDTSADFDRTTKRAIYASFGIPELWIVDLGSRKLERSSEPAGDGYRIVQVLNPSDSIVVPALPEFTFPVAPLLP